MSEHETEHPALMRLRLFCGAAQDPQLDDETLQLILDAWARSDAEGRAPSDEEWAPTYLLAGAVADAWRAKAAAASDRSAFAADGSSFQRDQVYRHCMQMADSYQRRAAAEAGGGALTRPGAGMKRDRAGGASASRTVTL